MRAVAGIVGAAVVVGGVGWGVAWGLTACGPLDRWLGRSGCVSAMRFDGYRPLQAAAQTVLAQDATVRLIGRVRSGDAWQVSILAIDLQTGTEAGRFAVPVQDDVVDVHVSADGGRIAILCARRNACVEGGHRGLVVATTDGQVLEFIDRDDRSVAGLAGFADPPVVPDWAGFQPAWMPDGDHLAAYDEAMGDVVLRALADGAEIRRLRPEEGQALSACGWTCVRLVPSPSGRLLAAIAAPDAGDDPTSIVVWNTESGAHHATYALDHALGATLGWMPDETRLIVVGATGDATTETQLTVFALP